MIFILKMKYVLLIRAPKSGISLLQSILNAHDEIYLIYEKRSWKLGIIIINVVSYTIQIISFLNED